MSKTIVALDFSSKEEVVDFLKQFDEPVYVKIGMELTYACGLEMVKTVKEMGHHIFLDLKLHDIPNTVKGGMKNLANLGVDIVNVHCAGGIAMMKAAIEQMDGVVSWTSFPGDAGLQAEQMLLDMRDQIFGGQVTAEEGMTSTQDAINALLDAQ